MPKKTLPLTDAAVRNAKPQTKPYKLADGGGLYLEVLPSGSRSWRLKYRFGGKERRLVFGLWPDISLKQARQRRDEARALLADDVDPGEKRKQDEAEAEARATEAATTFEVVAREWHSKQVATWSEGHGIKVMACIEQYLFPAFGNVPITSLRAPDILPTLRVVESKGINYTAKKLRQFCESIFAFAIATGQAVPNITLQKLLGYGNIFTFYLRCKIFSS